MSDVTQLLNAVELGDPKAASELLPLVYEELRRLAAQKMAHEASGNTLQPTALVHEAWLRLAGSREQQWQGRRHFLGAAAEAMRRILVDRARRKSAAKRGSNPERIELHETKLAAPVLDADDRLLKIHEVLDKLAAIDPPKAELVKLRYFVGLTIEEAASLLEISEPTANRWWAYSRAWLQREIAGPQK